MDFLIFIGGIFGILLILFGVIYFISCVAGDSEGWAWLFSILILLAGLLVAYCAMSTPTGPALARNACLNAGYAQAYRSGDNWYCLRFGDEPDIIKIDIKGE